jgi:hypothetical protein
VARFRSKRGSDVFSWHFARVAVLALGFVASVFNVGWIVLERKITPGRALMLGCALGAAAFCVRQLLNH